MGPLANLKGAKPKKENMLKWIDEVDQNRTHLRENDFDEDLLRKKQI